MTRKHERTYIYTLSQYYVFIWTFLSRNNLDPECLKSDGDIWDALDVATLTPLVLELEGGLGEHNCWCMFLQTRNKGSLKPCRLLSTMWLQLSGRANKIKCILFYHVWTPNSSNMINLLTLVWNAAGPLFRIFMLLSEPSWWPLIRAVNWWRDYLLRVPAMML